MKALSVKRICWCVWIGIWCIAPANIVLPEEPAGGARNKGTVPVTGSADRAMRPLDELMVSFVRRQEIPGAALAVAHGGQLIYARGFGYADREAKCPVAPDALFRIASISKPITAITILRLVDKGRLRLDDSVLEHLPADLRPAPGELADRRWEKITIRHLLQHRGGWDRAESIDCMFYPVEIATALGTPPPAGARQIIRFMQRWPLDFDPGERYAYSNFGYCLLGRVIEQLTGRPYERYVQEDVLRPLHIERMRIGRTLRCGRAPGEVVYYTRKQRRAVSVFPPKVGHPVAPPYGAWHLEAMDSHGGWIASAPDLVRFGSAVVASPGNGLLSAAMRRAMLERPPGAAGNDAAGKPKDAYYGLGWFVRPARDGRPTAWWHTGSLPGTSTLLVLRDDGWCWAVLFNTRETTAGKRPAVLIDRDLHRTIDRISKARAEAD